MLNATASWLRKLSPKDWLFGSVGLLVGGMLVSAGYLQPLYNKLQLVEKVPKLEKRMDQYEENIETNERAIKNLNRKIDSLDQKITIGMCSKGELTYTERQLLECPTKREMKKNSGS
jgi:hypothetical protein